MHGELTQMAGGFLFLLLVGLIIFNLPVIFLLAKIFTYPKAVIVGLALNLPLILFPYVLVRWLGGKQVDLLSGESVSINVPLLLASLLFTLSWGYFFYRQRSITMDRR